MPVVPEKRQLEDHVHAALGAQFWSQGVENSRYLSGQACTSPCEPQPLRLTAPSGLSRAQFLVATRAVRLPIFPGYCDDHGGTVLDRVLLQSGSHKWWAALIGRGKMQRAWNQHTAMTIRENLSDPHNYALAATGRLQLSDSTVLRATLQSDSLTALQPLLPQQKWNWQQSWNWGSSNALHRHHHQQQQQHAGQPAAAAAAAVPEPPQQPRQQQQQQQQQQNRLVRLVQGNSLKLQLKQQLEGLDLSADLALNEMCVDGVTRYAATPLRLAVDIAPSSSSTKRVKLRQGPAGSSGGGGGVGSSSGSSDTAAAGSSGGSGWLQGVLFRVGVHGVVAPLGDVAAAGGGGGSGSGATRAAASSSNSQQQQQQREHRVSLHAQGALALTGSATLWQAADKPWESAAAERRSHHKQQQQLQQQRLQQAALTVQPLQVTDNNSSSSTNNASAAAQQGGSTVASKGDGSSSSSSSSSSKDSSSTKQQKGSSSSKGRHSSSSSSRGVGGKPRMLTFQGQEFKLPLLNPGSVQESIQDASSSLERLRTDLRSWTTRVEAGELQNIGQKDPSAGILSRPPGSCWSSFIPGPHFKVCGLIGVLGRVPLHQQDILLPTSSSSSSRRPNPHHSRSSSAASLSTAAAAAAAEGDAAGAGASSGSGMRPEGGRPLGDRARGVLAASATHLDRLVLRSARKLGRRITQDSLLRLFGSAGTSLQVGEMRGNFFDFTRVEAVLDLGLNGPESLVQAPAAAAAAGAAGKSSGCAGVGRNRTRAGAAAASKAAGSSGGTAVRSASPARGMATILGPAAAAAHAAAAVQPPLPPSAAGVVVGSSDSSPRSSTIGSNASGVGGHPCPTAGSSAPAAALPPTGAGAAAAAAGGGGGSGVVGNSSSGSGTGRHKHPAFALDERGVWHSLTLSATQQLFGPVRLRADARLALDSAHPCPRGAGLLQPSAALQVLSHVVGVRPALVDAAYGVDVVVPGAGGLVRLVGWYSPGRGEGGLGLRLM